jgi:hypothetical protein
MKKALVFFRLICACCLISNTAYSQSWQSLGTGVNFSVYALEVDTIRDELYVGGWFTNAGGIPTNGIAKWDGTNWHSLNGGVNFGGSVHTIFYFNNEIYVGGRFDSIGGIAAKNIAKWDRTSWHTIGDGFNNTVKSICSYNTEIYAGGNFDSSGSQSMSHIARWDGSVWQNLNSGLNGPVYSMITFDNSLVIGGDFNNADTLNSLGRVVKWNGSIWSRIGIGFNQYVRNFSIYKGDLYVCGDFYNTTIPYMRYISRWDGSAWQALTYPGVAGSLSPGISDIIEYNGELHITGDFTTPRYVAKYNGSVLDSLEDGLSWAGSCFEIFKGDLIVGGSFSYAGMQVPHTNSLAKWVLSTDLQEQENVKQHIQIIVGSNKLKIILPNSWNSYLNYVEMFDCRGILIDQFLLNDNFETDISNIASGMYICRISQKDGVTLTGKFLFF